MEHAHADERLVVAALKAEITSMMSLTRLPGVAWLIGAVFHFPVKRLARLLLEADEDVSHLGLQAAARGLLARMVASVEITGVEHLPRSGPLLLISNHPAAYDLLILAAALPRDDLKIISSTISFVSTLPSIAPHFIFISEDVSQRMIATRAALRHLLDGGALLVFPRGEVEPDPLVSHGILYSLQHWSLSIDFFLRKAPQTQSVVCIISGVLSGRWFRNPFVRLWKRPEQRQKIAEIFQVAQQMVLKRPVSLTPQVSFSLPLSTPAIVAIAGPGSNLLAGVTSQARQMLIEQAASHPFFML